MIKRFSRDHPLVAFFLLAYALAWFASVPLFASERLGQPNSVALIVFFTFSAVAPTLAAVLIAGAAGGHAAIRDLITRLVHWRVHRRWWLFALLYYPATMLLGIAASMAMGRTFEWKLSASPIPYLPLLAVLLVVPVFATLEEIGWRGYALPILQERRSPLVASAIIGMLWGFWHLPAFFLEGMPQANAPLLPYIGFTVLLAIWFTWLYNHTHSILLVAVLHMSINYTTFLLGSPQEPVSGAVFVGSALLLTIIAIVTGRMAKRRINPPSHMLPGERESAA